MEKAEISPLFLCNKISYRKMGISPRFRKKFISVFQFSLI